MLNSFGIIESGQKIIGQNLVLSLDAAQRRSYPTTGTLWTNLAGNGVNSTLTNGPTFDSANGGSIKFDGSNDYSTLGTGTTINVFSGDFTVSAWVKRNPIGTQAGGTIIGDWYTGGVSVTDQWQIQANSSGGITTILVFIAPNAPFVNVSTGIAIGNWVNVVLSRIGSTVTLYSNTNSLGSVTNTRTWGTSGGNMVIGVSGDNANEPLNGFIGNILIYKGKGLTSTEVTQNYNAIKSRFGL